jgi:hypothetical protein
LATLNKKTKKSFKLNLVSDVITSAAPFFFTAGLLMFLAMPLWLVGQKKSGNKKLLIFIASVLFIIAGDKKKINSTVRH